MTKFQLLTAAAAVLAVPAISATTGEFSAQRLSDIDKTISSDAFEGRGPATRAETKTINYIADQFRPSGSSLAAIRSTASAAGSRMCRC